MATSLPTNIDTSYGDDPNDPSRKVHQQHHDAIHAYTNDHDGRVGSAAHAGLAIVSATAPASPAADELWYDTAAKLLKRWDAGANAGAGAWEAAGSAAYEAKVDRTGAAAGDVPALQGDGTLAFSSTTSVLHFGPGALEVYRGAPSLGSNSIWTWWLLDPATTEGVGSAFIVPVGWTTLNAEAWWINPGTGTGDVRLRMFADSRADGGTLGSASHSIGVNVAAAGQFVVKVTPMLSGTAVTPGELFSITVDREGGNAADTLANDAGLLAIVIRKAS